MLLDVDKLNMINNESLQKGFREDYAPPKTRKPKETAAKPATAPKTKKTTPNTSTSVKGTAKPKKPKASTAHDPHWEEAKHPRATDGRFGEKAGEHDAKDKPKSKTKSTVPAPSGTPDDKPNSGRGNSKRGAGTKAAEPAKPNGASKGEKVDGKAKTTKGTPDAAPVTKPGNKTPTSPPVAKPLGGKPAPSTGKGGVPSSVPAPTTAQPKPKRSKAGLDSGSTGSPAAEPTKDKKPPKAASEGGKGKKPKAVADIRSEAQANRELAYDVGDKVGGARKDTYTKNFTADPTMQNLEALEKEAPEVAQKMCVKANILPKLDFESEFKNGVEINAAMLKQLLYDRIAPKPQGDKPEDRKAYLMGINKLHRIFAPMKTVSEMRNAISELGQIASAGKRYDDAKESLAKYEANPKQYSYFNADSYKETLAKASEAKKMLDFSALGDKLEAFFTKYDSRMRTIQTISDKKLNWDTYFKAPEEGEDEKKRSDIKGAGKKKWERMAVSEHQRTGGKETSVKKPEDMVSQFGMKGVEFGNWVDDASGLFHLKRSAEAFHDLADIVGVEDKDISLNGRLSMAFGARGKAGAVAHYEPDRKVINMTKFGGAGSLAHEWAHALDNIMYAYSHDSGGSLSLAADAPQSMGDNDPELKRLYGTLMDAVQKPTPGQPGGVKRVSYDTEKNQMSRYFPEMRRDIEGGMGMEDVMTKWAVKYQGQFDASMRAIDSMRSRFSAKELDKRVVSAQRELKANLKDLPHYVAQEARRAQLQKQGLTGRDAWGAAHIKGDIKMPTGQSEYYTRMQEFDGTGKPYYAKGCEMFARVFESLIEDKLTAKKRKNNYLVWDTKTSKGNLDAPFPVGEERTNMHQAMDALLNYIAKNKTLKKALILDLLKSHVEDFERDYERLTGKKPEWRPLADYMAEIRAKSGEHQFFDKETLRAKANDYTARLAAMEERRDPDGTTKRYAYDVDPTSEVYYIPVNRLNMVYQTPEATNWDKVKENMDRMKAGERLEPVVVGYDYDVHDGHHRWLAAKALDHTHVPCQIGGTNELDVQKAKERYGELWKSIIPDPAGNSPYTEDGSIMFRGIGEKEKAYIQSTMFVQSKGKGNDDDKGTHTCFSNRFQQAMGYARSQYDLYGESQAYVLVLPRPPWVEEDEHGELVANQPVPAHLAAFIPVDQELRKSFDEAKHPRQEDGKFGTKDAPLVMKADKKGPKPKAASEEKITLFHGTALINADTIQKSGFKAQRSGNGDMGKCAYFKSPAWDHTEDEHGKSARTVNYFANDSVEQKGYSTPAVIHATIDKKHLLDCSKGRPQELQDMIDATRRNGDKRATPRWDRNSSPYEAYAKKHGIKAIIDKLDTAWDEEGWQIGVYDPKIIKVMDVGKGLKGEGAKAELMKALTSGAPYCLLHHEFDSAGNLVLHIGATSEASKSE